MWLNDRDNDGQIDECKTNKPANHQRIGGKHSLIVYHELVVNSHARIWVQSIRIESNKMSINSLFGGKFNKIITKLKERHLQFERANMQLEAFLVSSKGKGFT